MVTKFVKPFSSFGLNCRAQLVAFLWFWSNILANGNVAFIHSVTICELKTKLVHGQGVSNTLKNWKKIMTVVIHGQSLVKKKKTDLLQSSNMFINCKFLDFLKCIFASGPLIFSRNSRERWHAKWSAIVIVTIFKILVRWMPSDDYLKVVFA